MRRFHIGPAAIIRVALLAALLAGVAALPAQAQPAPGGPGGPPQEGAPDRGQPPFQLGPQGGPPGFGHAGGPDKPPPNPAGPDGGKEGGGPLAGLARAEADGAAADAIADLAHAPREEVQRILRAWNLPTALRYYDIEPKAFHLAVTPHLLALVAEAAHDNAITAREADRLTAQLRQAPPGPPPPAPE